MERTRDQIASEIRPLLAVTLVLLIVTTVVYPLAVTGIGQGLFHRQANGSFISVNGQDAGSSLVGQAFTRPEYFHGRPSAAGAGYDPSNSSGSNLGPTSGTLINGIHDQQDPANDFDGITDRVAAFRQENGLADNVPVPADAVTASASGLDPHVSPATARLQVARVAAARGAPETAIRTLVDQYTEGRVLGLIGEPRVNVLKLNIALDRQFPMAAK